MRISEIEKRMEKGNFSDETLEQFKSALKRVPKANRCQHCYTTANTMPPRYYRQAIALIQYGLQEHCSSWSDCMRSHHNIAELLEAHGQYVDAKREYEAALSAVDPAVFSAYEMEYAAHLMRTELHISRFAYTQDLEKYYNTAAQAPEFSQVFQKKMFWRLLAEIVIFRHHGDLPQARDAYAAAQEMLHPDFTGPLTMLLKRKGFAESAGVTREARAFLRRVSMFL